MSMVCELLVYQRAICLGYVKLICTCPWPGFQEREATALTFRGARKKPHCESEKIKAVVLLEKKVFEAQDWFFH